MKDKKVLDRLKRDAFEAGYTVGQLCGTPAVKCKDIAEAKNAMMKIGVDLIMEKSQGYYWLKAR